MWFFHNINNNKNTIIIAQYLSRRFPTDSPLSGKVNRSSISLFKSYQTNEIMDWISSFFSNNYGKLTTTAMVCFLLYKTYQYHHLQQKLAQVLEMKSLLLQELSTTKEDLRKLSVIERQESLCDVIFFTGREKGCADHVVDNYDCPLDSCPAYKMRYLDVVLFVCHKLHKSSFVRFYSSSLKTTTN